MKYDGRTLWLQLRLDTMNKDKNAVYTYLEGTLRLNLHSFCYSEPAPSAEPPTSPRLLHSQDFLNLAFFAKRVARHYSFLH